METKGRDKAKGFQGESAKHVWCDSIMNIAIEECGMSK